MATNKRKCKNCNEVFEKQRPLQFVCSPTCATQYGAKQRLKQVNKEWKEANKAFDLKHKPSAREPKNKKVLQDGCNKLAKMVDALFGYNTCIDCGGGFGAQTDACHYHSKGAHFNITYNLHNLHSGNSGHNQHSPDHKQGYEKGLIKRYGQEYFDMVEGLPLKYPKIGLSAVETMEKAALVNKLIRNFGTFQFENAIQAREQLNNIINIYK